ncbi:MAG: hypothetical protein ACPG7U_05195, partial [Holosporaceae bacterium]
KIKSLNQLKELSIISHNRYFYRAYKNWVEELCCNKLAGEEKDCANTHIVDTHNHFRKGLSWWHFSIKKDLRSFLTHDKNCKTYEGTIDDLTDDLCRKNTIISLKRP